MTQHNTMNRYLRIDTSDISLKREDDGQQSQLPTPLPSATEGRRGSVASSDQWSFMSCPSSVSSIDTRGPVTPQGGDSSWSSNYNTASSDISFDGIGWPLQGVALKPSFEYAPPAAPCTPVSPSDEFEPQALSHWPWSMGSMEPSFQMPHHAMMPAAGDFGNAFESSLNFHPDQTGSLSISHEYSEIAASTERKPSMDFSHHYADFLHGAAPDEVKPFEDLVLSHPLKPDPMTTITPADAFIQEQSLSLDSGVEIGPVFGQYGYDCSSRLSSPSPCVADTLKSDDDMDYTPTKRENSPCVFYETPRGGKSVSKRRKQRITAAKRRNRDMINYRSGDIDVACTTDLHTNKDGYLVAGTRKATEKQPCGVKLQDGSICDKAFERVEHLKRHQETHTGIRDYHCVLCPKKFNRNDNRNAHYFTHLDLFKKGQKRNPPFSAEHLFGQIRKHNDPEHSEKTIKSLITELAKGKHGVDPNIVEHLRLL